jgi:hypothetical protein
VGDENAGAQDAEERGEYFQHGKDPWPSRHDLTARGDAQSKKFRSQPDFAGAVMISCNTPCRGDRRPTIRRQVPIWHASRTSVAQNHQMESKRQPGRKFF